MTADSLVVAAPLFVAAGALLASPLVRQLLGLTFKRPREKEVVVRLARAGKTESIAVRGTSVEINELVDALVRGTARGSTAAHRKAKRPKE